jgi:predicted nuclease of restriction endonuclease-like (RecB) superfamily
VLNIETFMANELQHKPYSDLLQDAQRIVESSQRQAYVAINMMMVQRNWLLGKRIAEEELRGEDRAEYGAQLIKQLSIDLTKEYGKGFDASNLYKFTQFYKYFPNIFHTVRGKSQTENLDTACLNSPMNMLDSVRPKSEGLLSWSHYRALLQVDDAEARTWYAKEAFGQTWSVRTLQRNISSQYYYRLLQSQKKELVKEEMLEKTEPLQQDKLEFIKNPVVAEFLGLSQNTDFRESTLEKAIISNMERFLLEMGKGFAFVERQQHIHTEKEDYYIDLVFYNYMLKCFILIDLKTTKVTHQDVGQMDMYVRMYDELKRQPGDNPTLGILLCADTDDDIARFSILHDNDHIFASKYLTYLPSKEQLRAEIERQKMLFYLQQAEEKKKNVDESNDK